MAHTDRPRWLTEPCPPWCARDHHDADHPEDRYHQSETSVLTGTQRTGSALSDTAPVELAVWIGRDQATDAEWLTIEALEQAAPRIRLTIETATALRDHLDHQLRLRDPRSGRALQSQR